MADDTAPLNADTKPLNDKPKAEPAKLADIPPTPPPPVTTMPVAVPEPEPDTAKAKLRAFEDEHLGKDAVRIGGEIEKGHGSPYAGMRPDRRRHYEALERLVEAEQRLDAANVALTNAKVALETAEADVENAAKLADQKAVEAQAAEKAA
jgi:hypothetical protein